MKSTVKATLRQRKALDFLVENGGNVTKAMREAKYSENTINTPQRLTESKGFIALCEERGLTDNLLVDALVDDIKSKKGKRTKELELGFKVKGKIRLNEEPESQEKQTLIQILNVTQNLLTNGVQQETDKGISQEQVQELLR